MQLNYVICPNCERVVNKKDQITIDTGERRYGVIPLTKTMCKTCVKEYNKKENKK